MHPFFFFNKPLFCLTNYLVYILIYLKKIDKPVTANLIVKDTPEMKTNLTKPRKPKSDNPFVGQIKTDKHTPEKQYLLLGSRIKIAYESNNYKSITSLLHRRKTDH